MFLRRDWIWYVNYVMLVIFCLFIYMYRNISLSSPFYMITLVIQHWRRLLWRYYNYNTPMRCSWPGQTWYWKVMSILGKMKQVLLALTNNTLAKQNLLTSNCYFTLKTLTQDTRCPVYTSISMIFISTFEWRIIYLIF